MHLISQFMVFMVNICCHSESQCSADLCSSCVQCCKTVINDEQAGDRLLIEWCKTKLKPSVRCPNTAFCLSINHEKNVLI